MKNPSCRERQMQPPRKNRYDWFQQVPVQWVGYYRLARAPLCCAALPWHSDEGFLSWFRVLVTARVYPCAPPLLTAHWFGEVTLSPCPHHPIWKYPSHILQCWGVQSTSCHCSHNEHNTETENCKELTYFLFICCNLVQLNPNIKSIFKQSYWE